VPVECINVTNDLDEVHKNLITVSFIMLSYDSVTFTSTSDLGI